MVKQLSDVREVLLAKPGVRAAYDELRDEFDLADALIRARIRAGLTQSVVAERMRTSQAAVARLESGRQSPSYRSLQKYAEALGSRLKIELVPVSSRTR
jgi:ribosome-binding protein aMBF1 (putative translation factor)